jgi:predicted LPLAT superfamily acyltransferase
VSDRPHAPARGRLSRLLGTFHVTGAFWFRIHRFGARVLPERGKVVAIALFASFFFVALRSIRSAVAANLVPVLGPCGWWERQRRIFRTLHTFAWCLTERYERLSLDVPFDFRLTNGEALDREMRHPEGLIFVTSHVGNWEVGAAEPAGALGRRIHLVRERELDPKAQAFIEKLLEARMGDRFTTHFAADDPSLAITLREALTRGELVALQGDRPRAGGRTVAVSLLERPFHVPVGPLALARAAAVALMPVYVFRRGRRQYEIVLCEPIRVRNGSDRRADLTQAAEELAAAVEWALRHEPHQWFCFRELWPEPSSPW